MAYDQLMQTYLGVGLLANRPAAPNVAPGVAAFYYGTDTGALYVWHGGTWDTLGGPAGGAQTVQLDWSATTDIVNGLVLPPSTWTDIPGTSQSFNVAVANSDVEVQANGYITCYTTAGSSGNASVAVNVDGVSKLLGGTYFTTGNSFPNLLAGVGPVRFRSLPAGSHTVKLQAYCGLSGGTLACRCATQPNVESLSIRVLEEH